VREIEAVSGDQLLRVAREVLDPARLGISALGTGRNTAIRPGDLVA